jgi:hypothetical protein
MSAQSLGLAATAWMMLKQRMLLNLQLPLKEAAGRGRLHPMVRPDAIIDCGIAIDP